jgi:hypothetical protein
MARTSMAVKDIDRVLPKQIIVELKINGQKARGMIDTGSMMDFIR